MDPDKLSQADLNLHCFLKEDTCYIQVQQEGVSLIVSQLKMISAATYYGCSLAVTSTGP